MNYSFAGPPNDLRFDIRKLEYAGDDGDGLELVPWDKYVFQGFGSLVHTMGYVNEPVGIHVEVDGWDDLGDGTVRTPMLELSGSDYEYVSVVGSPYPGMLAVSDVGAVYEYQPFDDAFGGLFKRIAKGIKKIGKKAGQAIKKGVVKGANLAVKYGKKQLKKKIDALKNPMSAMTSKWKDRLSIGKKLLSKTKFGRAAIKIGDKYIKAGIKIVKPLAKKVGEWAPRLAPVAALIPGVGPAISGAMLSAGTIANRINQYGGQIEQALAMDEKTGVTKKINTLRIDPNNRVKLAKALMKDASKYKRMPNAQIQDMLKNLQKKSPAQYARPLKPITKATAATATRLSRVARTDYNTDIQRKVVQASRGNAARQKQISNLVRQLSALGFRFT
jgi:hypothetical protein